jgi:hypothetical protein
MTKILKDLETGKSGELLVKGELEKQGFICELNTDKSIKSDFDLEITKPKITIEVKNDLYATKSGNIAIEYYNPKSDKASGIAITKSDIWCHIIDGKIFVIKTPTLKEFIKNNSPKKTIKKAGDGNASIYLYAIDDIIDLFIPIERIKEIICLDS